MNIAWACCPSGPRNSTRAGHRVLVEAGAGLGSGLTDERVRPRTAPRWSPGRKRSTAGPT